MLHNFALQRNEPKPIDDGSIEIQQIKRQDIGDRRLLLIAPIPTNPRGLIKRNEIISTYFDSN